MKPSNPIAGLVLAAGASERMGSPKALLEFPDGTSLLTRQVETLKEGGCTNIFVVVGTDAEKIKSRHQKLASIRQ